MLIIVLNAFRIDYILPIAIHVLEANMMMGSNHNANLAIFNALNVFRMLPTA